MDLFHFFLPEYQKFDGAVEDESFWNDMRNCERYLQYLVRQVKGSNTVSMDDFYKITYHDFVLSGGMLSHSWKKQ